MKLNICYNVNCVDYIDALAREPGHTPWADLIVADPPFNIGYTYDIYRDSLPAKEYMEWTKTWLKAAVTKCLKPHGNLLVCMGDEYVSRLDILCQDELNLVRKDWLIWHYSFGQSGTLESRRKFTRSKTHILRFGQLGEDTYFDATAVAVPSDRQLRYNDKRADIRGKCPNDLFNYRRIAGTHRDRVPGVATQMPPELVSIWVKALCPPTGTVFSPFAGSGTDLVAAKMCGRSYVGCEISPTYIEHITRRLDNLLSPAEPIKIL